MLQRVIKLLKGKIFVGVETEIVFDSQRIGAYLNMLQNGEVTFKLGKRTSRKACHEFSKSALARHWFGILRVWPSRLFTQTAINCEKSGTRTRYKYRQSL